VNTVGLLVAATRLGTTPVALIEMALQARLAARVWQPGWSYVGVLFGADFDIETFTPVEEVPELDQPYQLRPGYIQLEPHQLAQLRCGRVCIRDAGDTVSGFQVLLAEPIELGWDSVMIDTEELKALRADSFVARQQVVGCDEKSRAWPEVLTLTDLASYLRVSRGAAERFAQRNNLVVDVDGRRRVLRSRVEALSSGSAACAPAKRPTGGSRPSSAVFVLASD